jgi:hypothetical protein
MAAEDDHAVLLAEVKRLSAALVLANDATFALAGIIGRVIVEAGIVSREELSEAIERRAGEPNAEDYNPLLTAFARAVRMNFPGGTFDVVDGGMTRPVDPDPR